MREKKNALFHIRTLRQRLILILSICMLLSFLLVVSVSYVSLKAAEKNRVETTMQADLLQLTNQMDSDYYTLVQMSQQMAPEGNVGKLVDSYLSEGGVYERIDISGKVTSDINTMIFSHKNISLVGYFCYQSEDKLGRMLFFSLPLKENSSLLKLATVTQTGSLKLQAIHKSLNYSTSKDAVSIIRSVRFSDDTEGLIYVELFSEVASNLQSLSKIRNVPYGLLQVDGNGEICFSSSEAFKTGDVLDVSSPIKDFDVREIGEYTYFLSGSRFGFINVLLVPTINYHKEMLYWQLSVFCVFMVAMVLVTLTGFLLFHLIYRPLQMLGRDMSEVGKGNLVPTKHSFHIDEFDNLFEQFDDMKREILQLLDNVRRQEQEKQQLEIDKLYYQINPHFLMNTLHSVHCMAVTNRQPEIDRFIYRLNYILGYSLGKTDSRATLRTELKYLNLYMELQKERYDFEVRLDIEDGDYLDYPSARLILQPLAENAICHNMNEFGNLWVTVKREKEDYVKIIIRDDGRGFVPDGDKGASPSANQMNKGIGLRYVRMSLLSFYGDNAHISIASELNYGTAVTLLLPVQKGK